MHPLLSSVLLSSLLISAALAQNDAANDSPSEGHEIYSCKEGPWGRVMWHYIHLEAPDSLLEYVEMPSTQSVWTFHGTPPETVRRFLVHSGLREDAVERLLSNAGPEDTTLYPTPEDILGLTPASRATIYAELARFPQNEYHEMPVCILDDSVTAWLGKRKIRPELVDLIERTTFRKGEVFLFCDPSLLVGHSKTAAEAWDMIPLTTRTRAVMAWLDIGPKDDAGTVMTYWTAGHKHKDILPILNSLSNLPSGGRLSFGHLLPPEPRKYLYTYPVPSMATRGGRPDCNWSSLNFFNRMPRQFYMEPRLAMAEITESFDEVAEPSQFGDIVVLLDPDSVGVHSCVWLCDQLVYTKNGGSEGAPWIISTLSDVKRAYDSSAVGPLSLHYFRRKSMDE